MGLAYSLYPRGATELRVPLSEAAALPPGGAKATIFHGQHLPRSAFSTVSFLRCQAQCCFHKLADLRAHLRFAHRCEPEALKFVNERLPAYQLRGGDGLAQPACYGATPQDVESVFVAPHSLTSIWG